MMMSFLKTFACISEFQEVTGVQPASIAQTPTKRAETEDDYILPSTPEEDIYENEELCLNNETLPDDENLSLNLDECLSFESGVYDRINSLATESATEKELKNVDFDEQSFEQIVDDFNVAVHSLEDTEDYEALTTFKGPFTVRPYDDIQLHTVTSD